MSVLVLSLLRPNERVEIFVVLQARDMRAQCSEARGLPNSSKIKFETNDLNLEAGMRTI